jgi:hypothetical protein
MPRMKNPHWTPEQERRIEQAEALGTRATILELGVAEFLKTHMPCTPEIIVAKEMLGESVGHRETAVKIHAALRSEPRRTKGIGAAKFGRKKEA